MGMNQSIHDQGLVTPALTINDTLLVASGSNVGVGTSDPKVPLDVYEMGGLYLGYTALAGSGTGGSEFTVTTTWTVIDATARITFVAPKSGKVEIRMQIYVEDNSTYNSLGSQYQRKYLRTDTEDELTISARWLVTGLTAGTSYTYYIGSASNGSGQYKLRWGGSNASTYPHMIIAAISVPNTTAS